jgi:hypothetical protein
MKFKNINLPLVGSSPCVNMKSCHFVAHLFTKLLQSSNVMNLGKLLYSLKLAYISRLFWRAMGIIFLFKLGFACSSIGNSFHNLKNNVE